MFLLHSIFIYINNSILFYKTKKMCHTLINIKHKSVLQYVCKEVNVNSDQ